MNEDELRARGYDPHIVKIHIVKGTAEEAAAAILWASLIKIEGPMSRSWSLLAKTMNEVAFLIGRDGSDITEDIARRQYIVFAKNCAMTGNQTMVGIPEHRQELYAGFMKRFTEVE